ncbi:MAG TPA: VanW family protein [Abditibacteriaceae bacterium]|nr:VanW family protein [Abditibacteriaceae bacterium]
MFFPSLRRSVFAYLSISAALCLGCQTVLAQQLPAPAPPSGKAPRPASKPKPAPSRPTPAPKPDGQFLPDPAIPDEQPAAPDLEPTPLPEDTTPEEVYPPSAAPTARPAGPPKPRRTPTPSRASVGGVSIRGLSDTAAYSKLRRTLRPKLSTKVVLSDGDREYSLSRSQLGAKLRYGKLLQQARRINGDVPVRFEVDMETTQRALRGLAAEINRPGRPARLDVEAGRVVLRGGDGVTLAVDGSAQRVRQALEAQPPRSRVDLVVARTAGRTPTTTLRQFRYLLASFSTPYDARLRGRTHNLRIAANNVDGTIVPVGALFSTNNAIGPRNAADGWREAHMFVSGQVVNGVGAGICQCATTLYNAALLAGLPIVERHPHMFRVTYAPASRDATLYWNSKDFRFRNTTNGPIYVQTFLSGGRFHARLYGTEPVQKKIQVESRTLSRRNGTTSEAYRIVRSENGILRERLSRDHYKPHP